jgi:hypothetical protein
LFNEFVNSTCVYLNVYQNLSIIYVLLEIYQTTTDLFAVLTASDNGQEGSDSDFGVSGGIGEDGGDSVHDLFELFAAEVSARLQDDHLLLDALVFLGAGGQSFGIGEATNVAD